MKNVWEQLARSAAGQTIQIARREADWVFAFGTTFCICIEAFWRIRDANMILLTGMDDGHKFGLPAPIDAEKNGNELLAGRTVQFFEHDASTSDLKFKLSDGLIIEVLTNSSGYESWQAYLNGELLGVGGNGGLR